MSLCECGHPFEAHQHYRRGAECSLCDCPKFRKAPREARMRWHRIGFRIGFGIGLGAAFVLVPVIAAWRVASWFVFHVRRGLTLVPSYVRFVKWRLILHSDLVQAGMDAGKRTKEEL